MLAVAALLALVLVATLGSDRVRAMLTGVPDKKHIAVLPFAAIGSGEDKQAFADGMTETVTSKLSALEAFQKALWVVPASEVRARKLTSVEETRKAFGVTLVITGNVQIHGKTITVTANLIDAKDLKQLQSRTITLSTQSAASIQNGVIDDVAGMMGIRIAPQARRTLSAGQAENPEAFRLYEEGLGYLRRFEEENIHRAITLFRDAVGKDPGFALGYTRLGEAYLRNYEFSKNAADVELAKLNVNRALKLDAKLASGYATLASILTQTGHLREGIAEFHKALEMDPADGVAWVKLAQAQTNAGEFKLAESTFQHAIEIRPDYWFGYLAKGAFYFGQGQYTQAEKMFQAVIELTPESALGYRNLGAVYLQMGRYPDAERTLQRSLSIQPNAMAYSNLSICYSFNGKWREAVDLLRKAVTLDPNNDQNWRNLGDAYLQVPEFASQAIEAYKMAQQSVTRLLAVNPNSQSLLISSALYAAKLNDSTSAAAKLRSAYSSGPLSPALEFKAGIVRELIGDRQGALSALDRAIERGFSREQVAKEPELAALRKDVRFQGVATRHETHD